MRVNIPTPSSALAIGAHPDDIEFECGATLAKWADAGAAIHFLVCTDGSKGTWDVDADKAELISRRRREQTAAARRIHPGAQVHFLDQVDGELDVALVLRGAVARVIRQTRPDVVLGHDPWRRWRMHPDHRAAGQLAVDGVVAARDPHFNREHINDGLAHHRPDHLLLFECEEPDLTESVEAHHVARQVDALLAHESQFETTMVIAANDDGSQAEAFGQRIRTNAQDRGRRAGVPFGEAFKLMNPAG